MSDQTKKCKENRCCKSEF